MPSYNEFKTEGNKAFSQGAEKAASKAIMLGADIIKAFFKFLAEMLRSFLGK